MTKLLVAVKSCERDTKNGFNQAVRETWGADAVKLGCDVRFFTGRVNEPLQNSDEISVDAPDDYDGLPHKTHGIAKWIVTQDYDYTFLCDTDTFVKPTLLLSCGFDKFDYSGYYHDNKTAAQSFSQYRDDRGIVLRHGYWWASGGVGYFISREATKTIAQQIGPDHWAEDLWVGQVLNRCSDLKIAALQDFIGVVSWHYNAHHRPYETSWMYKMYREYGR